MEFKEGVKENKKEPTRSEPGRFEKIGQKKKRKDVQPSRKLKLGPRTKRHRKGSFIPSRNRERKKTM